MQAGGRALGATLPGLRPFATEAQGLAGSCSQAALHRQQLPVLAAFQAALHSHCGHPGAPAMTLLGPIS